MDWPPETDFLGSNFSSPTYQLCDCGKFLNLFVPWFRHPSNGDNKGTYYLRVAMKVKLLSPCDTLRTESGTKFSRNVSDYLLFNI